MDPAPSTSPHASSGAGQAVRARAFIRRTIELAADEVHPIDGGWVLRTPSLPDVWNLNHVRIAGPTPLGAALTVANRHLGDLPYRHIVLEHDPTGAQLERPFSTGGWKVERDLLMALAGAPQPPVTPAAVVHPSEAEMLALMRRWGAEELRSGSDQLVESSRREGRAWNERRFTVAGDDGHPAAITKLRSDGNTAQVEDVYTVPEARGRGFARTLVAHAAGLAQAEEHELIFIVADDDDWPKQLYGEIGFAPIGRIRAFHRDTEPRH